MIKSTPYSQGYSIPAEWHPHEATWIRWPHQKDDWPGKMAAISFVYAEIVKYISRGEKVRIIVQSAEHQRRVAGMLHAISLDHSQVEFFIWETDRGWLRDSGPAFIKKGGNVALVDFAFNAWAKYTNYKKDNLVPSKISEALGMRKIMPIYKGRQVCLEGGSLDINGKGTLITTEECLMDPHVQVRNPGFTKADYEAVFKDFLGIANVLWLGKGIAGDDTHGHVDDLCRFVSEDTVVMVNETNEGDINYIPLKENHERLLSFKLENGKKLKVVSLPMPEPVYFKGVRLPASYANFYIFNGHVLVPTFNDRMDREALGVLSEVFAGRKVVGIHAVDLVWGLGTLHCLTREQPS